MKHTVKKIVYTCIVAIVMIFGSGLFLSSAHAATEFMTSWQSQTFVPAWYEGKAFPTYQSPINIGFEIVEDGKMVDLSKTAVRWYVDGKLFRNETNGLGIKQVIVFNRKYGGDISSIKISIPDYKGRVLEEILDIPIKRPEVVIDVPYFQKKVEKGTNTLYAWPFFFNATNAGGLSLRWIVDGNELQTGNANTPELLYTVGNDITPGSKSTIEAVMINQKKSLENVIKKVFVESL